MNQDKVFYHDFGFNYLVHARFLLIEGKYLKLGALCSELHRIFSPFNNLIGHLQAYILDAIAKNKLYGQEKAEEALNPALALGRADGLILPFADYGQYIDHMLSTITSRGKKMPIWKVY